MAKFTKKAIMHSFLELLEQKQIDKITVKDICTHCEINRNTFYYYYHDIYDVLKEAFNCEKEKILVELEQADSFFEDYRICAALILKYKKGVLHIYRSKAESVMGAYSRSVIRSYVGRFVRRKGAEAGITETEMERITRFCSHAITGYTIQWLDDNLPEYREEDLKQIADMMETSVDAMVQSCRKDASPEK